jgi:hypothetical protein
VDHYSVTRTWHEWEVAATGPTGILVAETTLPLDGFQEGFDKSAWDDLIDAAEKALALPHRTFTKIWFVPKEKTDA